MHDDDDSLRPFNVRAFREGNRNDVRAFAHGPASAAVKAAVHVAKNVGWAGDGTLEIEVEIDGGWTGTVKLDARVSIGQDIEAPPIANVPVLQCAGCGNEYLGEAGKDYSAGVLCPDERGRGLVGVCHVVRHVTPSAADKLRVDLAGGEASETADAPAPTEPGPAGERLSVWRFESLFGVSCWVATSAQDAARLFNETVDLSDADAAGPDDFTAVANDHVISIQAKLSEPAVARTAAEWARERGRGYLAGFRS